MLQSDNIIFFAEKVSFFDNFGRESSSLVRLISGRWNKANLKDRVTFSHLVQNVTYSDATRDFTVTVKNLLNDKTRVERFDYVIVGSGHFSTPNAPELPGVAQFPGRVIHSHDFRDANEFTGNQMIFWSIK